MKDYPTPRYDKLKANGRAGNVRFLSMRPKLTRGLHNRAFEYLLPLTLPVVAGLLFPVTEDATP
jgi:hypothetical protein